MPHLLPHWLRHQPSLDGPNPVAITNVQGQRVGLAEILDGRGWMLLGALLPFLLTTVTRGAITGWSNAPIDLAATSFSLIALSLATFIRILTHGRGKGVLGWLLMCLLIQLLFAIYLSGAFAQARVSDGSVKTDHKALARLSSTTASTVSVNTAELQTVSDDLDAVGQDMPDASGTAYIFIFGSGALSLIFALACWKKPTPETAPATA